MEQSELLKEDRKKKKLYQIFIEISKLNTIILAEEREGLNPRARH